MTESLPIFVIVIAGILVVVAPVAWRASRRQEEGTHQQPIVKNKKAFLVQFTIGLALALTGAFFMFDGDILGADTTGIATVIGIVGICLIAASNVTLLGIKRKE